MRSTFEASDELVQVFYKKGTATIIFNLHNRVVSLSVWIDHKQVGNLNLVKVFIIWREGQMENLNSDDTMEIDKTTKTTHYNPHPQSM